MQVSVSYCLLYFCAALNFVCNMERNAFLLKPGQKIKPHVTNEVIHQLVQKLFNVEVLGFKELNSYDDKNFHIMVLVLYISKSCSY